MHSHDVIILGGGAAGLTAASGMAQLGMKTALIDKSRLGGDCLYYGCVPSKSLLKSARVRELSFRSKEFGLPEPDLPKVEAGPLMNRIAGVISELEPHDSPERFRSLGCEVFLQGGKFRSEREVELEDGTLLSARNIIISTGSSPRIPSLPGLAEAGFLTNKDMFSLKKLPASLTVLGAGPIGVEMSQALARLGTRVRLIDRATHILPREDEDMAAVIQEQLLSEGVELYLDVGIVGVEKTDKGKAVMLRTAAGPSSVESEEILLALGRQGNTEGIGLSAAGVETDKSFIPCDAHLRSSRKNIMALGDVNGKFLFTHTAGAEGSYAVRRIALKLPGAFNYNNTPWTTYGDPELASVGYNEQRARAEGISYESHVLPLGEIDRARAEGESMGRMKVLTDKRGRIIGCQIAALHAGELLTPALFAVQQKWKLGQFLGPVYPYPTTGEIYRNLAGSVMGPKLFNSRSRKILRTLYRYRGRRD